MTIKLSVDKWTNVYQDFEQAVQLSATYSEMMTDEDCHFFNDSININTQ